VAGKIIMIGVDLQQTNGQKIAPCTYAVLLPGIF